MGFLTKFKAARAYRLQQKGRKEEALKLYEEAFSEGLNDPRYNLAYALMIIRRWTLNTPRSKMTGRRR